MPKTFHAVLCAEQFCKMNICQGLFILKLFGTELLLSVWTVRRQKKKSLIEQMRAME